MQEKGGRGREKRRRGGRGKAGGGGNNVNSIYPKTSFFLY